MFAHGSPPMADVNRRYSKNEFARRGMALFEKIRADLPAGNDDKFIAIDIETGEYEVHANEMTAAARLRKRVPDAQIWLVNAGTGFLDRFGGTDCEGRHDCQLQNADAKPGHAHDQATFDVGPATTIASVCVRRCFLMNPPLSPPAD
jgi:hypothetical protein